MKDSGHGSMKNIEKLICIPWFAYEDSGIKTRLQQGLNCITEMVMAKPPSYVHAWICKGRRKLWGTNPRGSKQKASKQYKIQILILKATLCSMFYDTIEILPCLKAVHFVHLE